MFINFPFCCLDRRYGYRYSLSTYCFHSNMPFRSCDLDSWKNHILVFSVFDASSDMKKELSQFFLKELTRIFELTQFNPLFSRYSCIFCFGFSFRENAFHYSLVLLWTLPCKTDNNTALFFSFFFPDNDLCKDIELAGSSMCFSAGIPNDIDYSAIKSAELWVLKQPHLRDGAKHSLMFSEIETYHKKFISKPFAIHQTNGSGNINLFANIFLVFHIF